MKDISNLKPVNSLARRVTSSAKEQQTLDFHARQAIMSKIPLPTKEYSKFNKYGKPINPKFHLKGIKIGKTEVIGLALLHKTSGENIQRKGHKKGKPWVLKCKCGYYFIKRHKPLLRAIEENKPDFSCYECQKIKRIKNER